MIKVHDFNGWRTLSATSKTNIEINPLDTQRTQQLKHWFHEKQEDLKKTATSNVIQISSQQGSNIFL